MSTAISRRGFLRKALAGAAGGLALGAGAGRTIEPIERGKESKMKIASCAYSYRKYLSGDNATMTMEDFVDTCGELGLDGVELTSYYFPKDVDRRYLLDLARKAFLLGLDVSGTAVGNKFTMPAGEERDKQIQLTKTWIDRGEILGAPIIRVFGGGVPDGLTEDQAMQNVVECCQECADYGAEHGVMVALENHGGVTATADKVLQMVKAVDSEWFGVNLDTGNFRTEDPYEDMAKVAPYTITTHIKTDIKPAGKDAEDLDYARVVEILRDVNYCGYLSFEYEAAEDPLTAMPREVELLREALA